MTTHFLSDIDLDQEDQLYEGLIVEPPVITRKLLDPVFRTLEMQTVEYALSNANGRFAAAYVADPKRFKGRATEIERYDAETGFILPRFTGEVTRARLERALLRIEAASVRWSVLEQLIPKASTVDTAGFPRAKDLGKTIPLVLGNVPLVPAVYVNENITGTVNGQPSGQFDFLIGRGAVGLFTGPDGFKVYRSPERTERTVYPVNDSEYTLSTGLYPGYTTLRFTVAQWDWNNARDQIWANVAGLQPERNFARAIRTILSNTTWGLSQAVNAASFDAAEALLNGIGSLFCDGVILEPTQAQDILRQLGMVRGMILGLNAAGEWTLTVDTLRPGVSLVLGDGPGDGPRNLVSCSDRDPLSTDDMTRDLILKYRVNLLNDTPMHEQRRVVSADFGKDRTVQADFIRNHTTAKKVKNYLGKRLQYGEETVRVSLTQEARALMEGDRVQLTYAPLGYAAAELEVREVTDRLTQVDALLQGWHPSIYDDDAETLPVDEDFGASSDLSRTTPVAASSLSISATGTEPSTDGSTVAFTELSFTTPTTNYGGAIARYRKNGTTTWTPVGIVKQSGAGVKVKITGLVMNQAYDYSVQIVNVLGTLVSVGDPVLSNQLAAKDTIAPAVPTGLVPTVGTGSAVSLDWNDNTEPDFGEYWINRGLTNDFASSVKIAEVRSSRFVDIEVDQGTAYRYWVRAADRSENVSAPSLMVTATPTGAAQGVTPGTPLAPTLSSSGTYQATDGRTLAFGIFNVPALPSQAAGINVLLRANGASGWQQVGQDFTGSSTVRVDDLTPGFAYQVAYQAFNAFGKPSAVSTVLNHTAVGDTNAPSSAGTPTIIAQKATTVTFKWAASASADRRGYNWDLRTAANGGGSVVASGFVEGETLTLDASIVGYGVARHFRVQPVDFSSNPGSFTSSVSVTFAQLGNIDLGSGSVQNPQIGSGAVGTPNIQAGATGGGQSAATDTIQVIGTSEVAVASITVATVGGFVHLSARVPYRGEGAGATSATFRLLKGGLGGTELDSITVAVGDDATLLATLLGKDDTPSASQLYTVVASTNAAAGMTVRTGRRILALNSRP